MPSKARPGSGTDDATIIVGRGEVVGQTGGLWAVNNGMSNVYIQPADMLIANPKTGDVGILTYEYRGAARRACFRAADDPAAKTKEGE